MYQNKKSPKLNSCTTAIRKVSLQKLRIGILASLFAASLSITSSVKAEEPVVRSGNFLINVPTPQCDGFVDYLEDAGEFFVDGVEYLGEKAINTAIGLGKLLLEGNPDALIDEVNQTFIDAASAAASLSKYTPLALISVIVDQLPEGSVTTFLKRGVEYQDILRAATASGIVGALNPIKLAETVSKDLSEITGDLEKVLVNLDDPLSAGNEFLKLQQKWSGAGALTYILTEKDPMTGMKKALNAMHRQVEIVTNYAGPKGKVASAVLEHAMNESKILINAMPDGEDKKVAALFAATFAVTFKNQLSDPNFKFSSSVSRHPMYSARLTNVNTRWLGDDHDSGSKYDWGFEHPVVEDKPGCISLGDYAYPGRTDAKRLNALCGVEDGRDVWWSRPVDYKLVWGDNCSGGTHDRSVWQPICPDGYTGVGFVASGNSSTKPLPNQIACLKTDTDLLSVSSGQAAGLKWVASDEGSGAKFDLTVYNRNFLGMQLMHAVPRDLGPTNAEYKQYNIAVPVAGQAPSYEKAHCVNFYTEADFKGWTHEACAIDESQSLRGKNEQMVRDGISSFQCGDEVAAVELYSPTLGSKVLYCGSNYNNYLREFDNFGFSATTYSTYTTSLGYTVLSAAAEARNAADEAAVAEALRVAPVLFDFAIQSSDVGGSGAGTVVVNQEPVSQVGGSFYTPGEVIGISAVPNERSEFQEWSSDAASCGSNLYCELTVQSYVGLNVVAIFKPKPSLTVFNVGGGKLVNGTRVSGGTIAISPEGYPCANADYTCLAYSTGEEVNLIATAREGTVFDGWRGDSDCLDGSVTMTENVRCEAVFKYTSYELSVAKTPGVEIVSDTFDEINCGTLNDCSEVYQVSDGEKTRTLRAQILPDYTFVRWAGLYDCYDEDERDNDPLTARVKVGTKNVQCNVVAVPSDTEYALTIEKIGGGTVKAEALPVIADDGIDCLLNACSQTYPVNTQVKLTAKASRGAQFIGFQSPDVGSDNYRREDDDCIDGIIDMTANISCNASFKTKILVVNGDYDSSSKEQNPYISVLRNQELVDYSIWHVQNPNSGDNSSTSTNVKRIEPVIEDLNKYGRVIWYTGDASTSVASSSPVAGPSAEAEGALAEYLDGGGCLLMSSPDYYKDRGLTPFMQNYLGIAEITAQDVSESYVKGAGEARFGFNEITVDSYAGSSSEGYFGITNNTNGKFLSDALVHNSNIPGTDAIFTYRESGAEAAIAVDSGIFRTMFFGFPFLAIPSGDRQNDTMSAFLNFCGQPDNDDVFEVNDELASAVERSGNVVLNHARIMPGNDDYFSWTSDWFADSTFSINFEHAKGDLNLEIYDTNGALLESSLSQDNNEQVIIENVDLGERFYVKVFGATSNDTNTYSLNISQLGDIDFDHDGVPDVDDAFPEDPSEQFDNDGDLIGNNADTDDDNDGLPDAYELANGFDPLVASDTFEDDADGDGYSDFAEYIAGTDPKDASSTPPAQSLSFFIVESSVQTSRVKNDVDGDGKSDLLWRSDARGWNFLWSMDGIQTKQARPINVVQDDGWLMAGQGDYDADGKSDIFWRNTITGQNFIYLMEGLNIKARKVLNYVTASQWELRGSGDFNGDGKGDVLWRRIDRGDTWFYMMDGLSIGTNQPSLWVTDLNFKIAAIGDINGDGTDDVIWRNQVTGLNYVWIMENGQIANRYTLNAINSDWTIAGAGDLDGDGTDDIILRNQIDGRNWAYFMENGQIKTSELINTVGDINWQIANMGDYDGDGKVDLLWRNVPAARNLVHLMNGLNIKAKGVLRPTDSTWQLAK